MRCDEGATGIATDHVVTRIGDPSFRYGAQEADTTRLRLDDGRYDEGATVTTIQLANFPLPSGDP